MQYDSYRYLSPPRPESPVHPDLLPFYQKRKWWAQFKKNGTCSVIYVPPKSVGRPFAKTRHADDPDHKAWSFTEGSIESFKAIQTDKWHVFEAELLHSKGHGVKDVNYVHDVLVYQGKHLINTTFSHRQALLKSIFGRLVGPVTETTSHWVIDEHTWLARCHQKNFRGLFAGILDPLDEGLVLKDPCGLLSVGNNSAWQVKCRKPTKNFGF
jgi:hypothetical protein